MQTRVIEVVPASTIYNVNNVSVTTKRIKEHLRDYRRMVQNPSRVFEDRLQAWQFVKAYTQILKDRGKWEPRKEVTP